MAEEMIKLRNKKTGQVITVPRSQYIDEPQAPTTGLAGIGEDISSSVQNILPAAGEMIKGVGRSLKGAGKYAVTTNPVSTLANIGMGGVEGATQLLSSPQILMRYLAKKFPGLDKRLHESNPNESFNDPTFYEALMKFEQEKGLAPLSPDEGSVRDVGSLIFGGKGLSKIPSATGRVATLSAQQAGAGGDPIHAAILGMTGEMLGKRLTKNLGVDDQTQPAVQPSPPVIPSANVGGSFNQPILPGMNVTLGGFGVIPDAVKAIPKVMGSAIEAAKSAPGKIPEVAGQTVASGLDTVAGLGSIAHIPVVPSLVEMMSDYLKYKSIPPDVVAQRKLFGDLEVSDLPQIQERMDAAKRLGLTYLSPAEATLSPFEAGKQGNIGRTSAGAKALYKKGAERSQTVEDSIETLKKNIYDPEQLEPQKQAEYATAMSAEVPDQFVTKWKQDPVVDQAMKLLDTKPSYKRATANIPKNSFQYWNLVKRVMGDMESGDAVGMQKFSSDQYTKARNEMVSEMDAIQPQYKTARKIAEREFTRNDIDKFFDKRNMNDMEFAKFLKSKSQFENLLDKLEPYPEATQNLRDMKLLFGNLIPTDPSIRTAAQQTKTSMWDARNKVDAMKRALDERYGKEHDVAAVNLMTDPEWQKMLVEFLKKKGKL